MTADDDVGDCAGLDRLLSRVPTRGPQL